MEPYLWLILKISPLLLGVAALFFWLGSRKEKGSVEHVITEKDATLQREQARHDETTRKLASAEDRLSEIQAAFQKVQSEFDTVLAQYEHLQRGAIPRRLLSEAEDRIIKLERELNRLKGNEPQPSAPAPIKHREPTPMARPATIAEPILESIPQNESVSVSESEAEAAPEMSVTEPSKPEEESRPEQEEELNLQSESLSAAETIKPKGRAKSTRRRR